MENEHHQWSANNLNVDGQNLARRAQSINDKLTELPLLWHLMHPVQNVEAKQLLKIRQLSGDVHRLLSMITTGNFDQLEHTQKLSESATRAIVDAAREKMQAADVPVSDLTVLQLIEILQAVESDALDDTEETFFNT